MSAASCRRLRLCLNATADAELLAAPAALSRFVQSGSGSSMNHARRAGGHVRSPANLRRMTRIVGGSGDLDESEPVAARRWDDEQARSELLNATRAEMYGALELFHKHVQHSVSLLFALITAVAVAVGVVAKDGSVEPQLIQVVRYAGGGVLLLALPFGYVSWKILSRYYRLYVAALIYAADLHQAEGIAGHPWFVEIEQYRKKCGVGNSDRLLDERTKGWRHTGALYALLVAFISLAAGVGGVLILVLL